MEYGQHTLLMPHLEKNHDTNTSLGAKQMNDALLIVNDKPRSVRVGHEYKHEQTFRTMRPGQAVKCAPNEVSSIASAMRRFIERTGANAYVKTVPDYGDGMGRVWMMEGKA
jgi:hypothetical protein